MNLQKEKSNLQKEVSQLNKVVNNLWSVIGRPSSLHTGLETSMTYMIETHLKNMLPDNIGKQIADTACNMKN